MLVLNKRDKKLVDFLLKNNAISTKQAINIIYDNLNCSAIRRLNQLEEANILESYKISKNKIYKLPGAKEISTHDLFVLDFYSWIISNGGTIIDFQKKPSYFKSQLIPDAIFKFDLEYQNNVYTITVLLEIDYTHYTNEIKLNTWYEKLYREEILKDYCGASEFPLVIIARPTKGIRYNSQNFNVIYTDLNFNNLLNLIFN